MHDKNIKTILFSLASFNITRNMAIFPNSVLDLLSKNPKLRIVILMKNPGLPITLFHTGSNVVVEQMEEHNNKTFLQKIFHFFYSFLIFTSTTLLVSSYGVRADKPRPLYRYYNFPLKLFISQTFGRSRFIRTVLVPKLYLKVFPERPFKHYFDTYKPDISFLPNICGWPLDIEFIAESKRQGIPTVGMPGNWDHLSKYFVPMQVDKLLVWSEAVKKEAVEYQSYDSKKIEIVGAPQADSFVDKGNIMPRGEFLKQCNFPENARIITYASQGPYSLDGADYIEMILSAIERKELPETTRIIIRPHPLGIKDKEKYEKFRSNPRVFIDALEGWSSIPRAQNFMNVLAHAEVVLTTYSSIATDAPAFDKPTIIASFDGYKHRSLYQSVRRHRYYTHFRNVIATNGLRITESEKEMLSAIKEYMDFPDHDSVGREKIREDVFGFMDGKNAERIYASIMRELDVK